MRIYLDMCSIQRPMDDHAQPRVRLEAEAVLRILAACDAGEAELLDSDALDSYFCTCDDRLLRRAKEADTGATRPVTPPELIEEIER